MVLGLSWDLRKISTIMKFMILLDFNIPVGYHGDCYDRYLIRVEEMRQSITYY